MILDSISMFFYKKFSKIDSLRTTFYKVDFLGSKKENEYNDKRLVNQVSAAEI